MLGRDPPRWFPALAAPRKEVPVLVLSRRAGESVVIADDVVVTVLEVRGDVIRLGIDAPRHVRVHREEVYREVQRANQAAAAAAAEDVDLGALLPPREAEPPGAPSAP
jgi:carbon storage regulator